MTDTAKVAQFVRESNIIGSLIVILEPLIWSFSTILSKQDRPYSDPERDAFVEKAKAHIHERLCALATEHYRQILTDEEVDQLLALIQSPLFQRVEEASLEMQVHIGSFTKRIEQELAAYAEGLGQTSAERPRHH